MTQYALFDTAAGWVAIAWSENGLASVRTPVSDSEAARHGLLRRLPAAIEAEPPPAVTQAIAGIGDLLSGGKPDLSATPLDWSLVSEFDARVYAIALTIPPGETLTYGEIATRLGDRLLARDVGQSLGRNPWPIVAPCHRVTAAGGKLGGFSAPGGAATKLKLLTIEGAAVAAAQAPAKPAAKPAQADLFG